jgi:hypothetical protein
MDEKRNVYGVLVRKTEVGRLVVRHGQRWEIQGTAYSLDWICLNLALLDYCMVLND